MLCLLGHGWSVREGVGCGGVVCGGVVCGGGPKCQFLAYSTLQTTTRAEKGGLTES